MTEDLKKSNKENNIEKTNADNSITCNTTKGNTSKKKRNRGKKKSKEIKIIEHEINYLCENWQFFIQQIQFMVNRGYNYYHIVKIPKEKHHKCLEIDQKLMNRYKMKKSKGQRAYNKEKGNANYFYYRCNGIGVMLRTGGTAEAGIVEVDKFEDIRKRPLKIEVSTDIEIELVKKAKKKTNTKDEVEIIDETTGKKVKEDKDSYTLQLSKDSYKAKVKVLEDVVKSTKNKKLIIAEFDKLNGLPVSTRIIEQKVSIAKWLVRFCKLHNVSLEYSELRINTFRKQLSNKPKENTDDKIDKVEEIEDSKNKKKTKSKANNKK